MQLSSIELAYTLNAGDEASVAVVSDCI